VFSTYDVVYYVVTNYNNVQIFKFLRKRILQQASVGTECQVEKLIEQNVFMKGRHSAHDVLFLSIYDYFSQVRET
jgi:hypothetical protein